MDNLNTHSPASFYEIFPPEQAKALADKREIHFTPKHARWLNIAEIELSVLARQGLARNARPRAAAQVTIHLFGVPDAFAHFLDLATA